MKLKNMSLRPILIIFYLASILIPLILFGGILYTKSINGVESEMRKVSLQSAIQVNKVFDEYINQVDKIILSSYIDSSIPEYLRTTSGYTENQSAREIWEKRETVYTHIENLMIVNPDIWSISLVSLNKDIITRSKNGYERPMYDFDTDEYYKDLRNSTGEMKLLPLHRTKYTFSPGRDVFTVGRRYLDVTSTDSSGLNTYIGYILIECNDSIFDRISSQVEISKEGYILILDQNKNLMYSTQNGERYQKKNKQIASILRNGFSGVQKVGNDKVVLVSNTSEFTGWTIACVIPYDEVIQRGQSVKNIFIILSIACILLVLLASMFISRKVTKPIKSLQQAMKNFESGKTDVRVKIQGYNEVGVLSHSFNQLIETVNSLITSIRSIEIKKQEAELDALRSQINPHFLYNTLDSIRMMAVIADQEQIGSAVKALADLFRYSIRQKKDIVDVNNELTHVRNYIYLQKMRYRNKFEVTYEIEDELLHYKTLKFTLQPIVENAIIHGFERKRDMGLLLIRINKQKDHIAFFIQDNGIGMSSEVLEGMRAQLSGSEDQGTSGIGIKNIHDRILLYFGPDCGLVIDSHPGQGTCVQFKIPLFQDEGWALGNVIGFSGR